MTKVLVIDIDETLLNMEPLFFLEKFRKNYKQNNGRLVKFLDKEYYLAPRPLVKEFIEKAKREFTLVAFSTASREYTIQKLKILGIFEDFTKVYGKEDLVNKSKSLLKVSKELNIPIEDVIAIDDSPNLFLEQDRVIKIKPFFIGREENYEFEEHEDNLIGALARALIL